MASWMTLDDLFDPEKGKMPPEMRPFIAKALRGKRLRGYKLGKRWYIDKAELDHDLKTLEGDANGNHARTRSQKAMESSVLRNIARIRSSGKASHVQVLQRKGNGANVLACEGTGIGGLSVRALEDGSDQDG